MKCKTCKIEMNFLGYIPRGFQEKYTSINWYCEKCNKIYYKIVTEDINLHLK